MHLVAVRAPHVASFVDGSAPVLRARAGMAHEARLGLLARGLLLRPRRRTTVFGCRAVRRDRAVTGLANLRHGERRRAQTVRLLGAAMDGRRERCDLARMTSAARRCPAT